MQEQQKKASSRPQGSDRKQYKSVMLSFT